MTITDEKLREAVKELSMAAAIADTFHARNCCAALDTIEAAITELTELRKRCEWQPIETAPKDAEILLFDGFAMSLGSWDLMDWCGQNPCWFPLSGATHWKPLPKPPAQKEGV